MITKTQLKEICLNNPLGFTINLKGEMIKKGFICSFTNRVVKNNLDDNIKDLFNILNSFNNLKRVLIGGWCCEGVFYLDLSLKFKSKKNALYFAKQFNQKAIFNLNKFEEIINRGYKENA